MVDIVGDIPQEGALGTFTSGRVFAKSTLWMGCQSNAACSSRVYGRRVGPTYHLSLSLSSIPDSMKRKGTDETCAERISGGPNQKKSRPGNLKAETMVVGNTEHKKVDSAVDLLNEGNKETRNANLDKNGVPIVENGVTFPERLMELIMNETDKEALWWLPDGNSFCINSKQFSKTILANNFQGSKFESFTRKLGRW